MNVGIPNGKYIIIHIEKDSIELWNGKDEEKTYFLSLTFLTDEAIKELNSGDYILIVDGTSLKIELEDDDGEMCYIQLSDFSDYLWGPSCD